MFLPSCVSSGRPDLSRIGLGVGWAGWKNLVCRTTSPSGCRTVLPSGCRATFEQTSFVQSGRNEIFGGGRGDLSYTFFVLDFSSLQSNNFVEYNKLEVFFEG